MSNKQKVDKTTFSLFNKIRRQFNRGCVDYGLLSDGDRIVIALSGGKDSLMLTQLMAERARIFRPHIEVEAVHVVMDNVPYSADLDALRQFCASCGVGLTVLHASYDESTDPRKTHCFLCAWHRRRALFEYAAAHGFNKVALGHHQDDILVTLLMNMTAEGAIATMPPLLPLEHYPLSIVRPMCLVHERLIADYAALAHFPQQTARCPYEHTTRRTEMQQVFERLEQMNPETRYCMWRAMENVKTDQLPRRS